jgi:cytoskeletal protein CcmA (bactofilin family)
MSIFSSNKDTRETTPPVNNYTPPVNNMPPPVNSYQSGGGNNYSAGSNLTTISDGTTLEGQIKIEGDIKVEGTVKGTITSKGRVIISSSGKVDGDIICQNADISGHVSGKLKIADILMLKGTAVIDGDINTGKLVIENGVKFNGNCTMGQAVIATPMPPKAETVKPALELNAQ